jgi:uroporphyrinogen-III synthase
MHKPESMVWLTRPLADSAHFAAELRYHGIGSLVAPVLHIVPWPLLELPAKPQALLLTSRHATHVLEELSGEWRTLPTYCVGAATASRAREFGFSRTVAGTSDVVSLLPTLVAQLPPGADVLYLAGEEIRTDVASLLGARGLSVRTLTVYTAQAETTLPEEALQALQEGQVRAASFFSPRSAQVTCELLQQQGLASQAATMDAYCLSLNVAEQTAALPWRSVHTCHSPTRRSMRELILSHWQKSL